MILCLSPVCHNSLPSKYAKSMWNQVLFQSHKNLKSHRPLRWDSQPRYNTVKMLARSLLLVKSLFISICHLPDQCGILIYASPLQLILTNTARREAMTISSGSKHLLSWFLIIGDPNLKSWYLWTMKPHSTSILQILLTVQLFYTGHVVCARHQSLLSQTNECLCHLSCIVYS